MKNKDFTQIPNRILKSKALLNHTEFRLYCVLQSFDYQKGFVYPGRERLAKEMGVSVSTVDRAKNGLEAKGAFKKKRRGQGRTNLYYLNQNFLLEADESQVIEPESSSLIRKEEKDNNTKFNNYLKTSLPEKKTYSGGKSQPSSKTQTVEVNPEVVFRSHLNRLKLEIDEELKEVSDSSLREEGLSRNTTACLKGIIYYISSYKVTYNKSHPLYKTAQLKDCMYGFLYGIGMIEERLFQVDKTVKEAIDHWFYTSPDDDNLQRLSTFVGNGSSIFLRSIDAVAICKRKGGIDASHII